MGTIVGQLRDVLATPTVIIYVLSTHPLLALLVLLILAIAYFYKTTGFTLRRHINEVVVAIVPSVAASPLIPLADDFDEWIWRVIKLVDTVSQLLVYISDGRLALIEHHAEQLAALEKQAAGVSVLEQAKAALERACAVHEQDNVALREHNLTLKQDNLTLAEDNAALKHANVTLVEHNTGLAQDNATLRQGNASLALENATLKDTVARQEQEIIALKVASTTNPALEREIVASEDTIASERHQHAAEKAMLEDRVSTLATVRDELITGQETLAAKLETTTAALTAATAAEEARSATEAKLRAEVASLKKKVDHLKKHREVHLADDSARTLQYRDDLAKVTAERDALAAAKDALAAMASERDTAVAHKGTVDQALVNVSSERDAAEQALATMTSERDAAVAEMGAAIAERDAAIAERDDAVTIKDAAVAQLDAEVAQHKATRRALSDMTSEKEVALAEKIDATVQNSDLLTRQSSTARALGTMTLAWNAAKKERKQAIAQLEESQRAVVDLTAEKDRAVAERDDAIVERDTAVTAHAASEAALVAIAAERDVAIAEKEAAIARETEKDEALVYNEQMEAVHKVAQKKIKELVKENESLSKDNAFLKGEIVKIQASCNNFKNLSDKNLSRMKIVRRDRDEWKEAHDRQVGEVSAKTATLIKTENDLRESVQKLGEQETLVAHLAARITELELGSKSEANPTDACDGVAVTQQHTPPASPDRDADAEQATPKKSANTLTNKFLLPTILLRRSTGDLTGRTSTPVKRFAHSRGGSRSSTSTLQRESMLSLNQNLLNNLAALGLPRDTRTT